MIKLKELRTLKGLSQADIALKLEITQQAYANYEREARQADYNTLKKLSAIFGVSIDYILDNESICKNDSNTEKDTIINSFLRLNDIGKEKAESYIMDLLDNPKYTSREDSPSIPSLEEAMRLQKGTPLRTDRLGHDDVVRKAAFGGGVWEEKKDK